MKQYKINLSSSWVFFFFSIFGWFLVLWFWPWFESGFLRGFVARIIVSTISSIPPWIPQQIWSGFCDFVKNVFFKGAFGFSLDLQWMLDLFATFFMDLLDLVAVLLCPKFCLDSWSVWGSNLCLNSRFCSCLLLSSSVCAQEFQGSHGGRCAQRAGLVHAAQGVKEQQSLPASNRRIGASQPQPGERRRLRSRATSWCMCEAGAAGGSYTSCERWLSKSPIKTTKAQLMAHQYFNGKNVKPSFRKCWT